MKTLRHAALDLVVVVLCIGLLLLVDVAFLVSLLQWMAFMAIAVCLAVVGAVLGHPGRSRVLRAIVIAVAALVIARIDWTVEKEFVRTLHRIELGMSEDQVREIMANYPEGTGWPSNPHDERSRPGEELRVADQLIFRPTTKSGDANWGMVKIGENGRVVAVEFSPD